MNIINKQGKINYIGSALYDMPSGRQRDALIEAFRKIGEDVVELDSRNKELAEQLALQQKIIALLCERKGISSQQIAAMMKQEQGQQTESLGEKPSAPSP